MALSCSMLAGEELQKTTALLLSPYGSRVILTCCDPQTTRCLVKQQAQGMNSAALDTDLNRTNRTRLEGRVHYTRAV